ncbi:MAG: cyclic nucleotide-binding domain-containing protein [Lachnospiraceae bacterium]|nr:cyclic nucleotide-binding domain-containing protein [Lachnospiraceae bacterium]
MKTITYASGEVIFHEGELALTMFDILQGSVAIYLDYDSDQRQLLTVLKEQQLLGEMGLIEACPRSATAVAMEDGTTLQEIAEEEFYDFFQHNPERLLQIMRQMSARIRENTEKYRDTCRTLLAYQEAEDSGKTKSAELEQHLQEISSTAKKRKTGYAGLQSSFFNYVLEDLTAYEGKREIVRANLVERLFTKYISPQEMHVNPDDEFADPEVGPSDRIINEYVHEIPRLRRFNEEVFPTPIMVYKMAIGGYLILNGHHRWAAALKSGQGKIRATIQNPSK